MSRAIMLVGVPCSGKTSWIQKESKNLEGWKIISSDDIIDRKCAEVGLTYSEGFKRFIGDAEVIMWSQLDSAMKYQKDVIIDRTNITRKSRKRFLDKLKSYNYKVDCVVFSVDYDVLKERLEYRGNMTGKVIPIDVIDSMIVNYDEPEESEGFNKILRFS